MAIILLLINSIIWYHYAKKKGIIKMENNGFQNVCIKGCTRYYFDDIIKLDDFDPDNYLIDK